MQTINEIFKIFGPEYIESFGNQCPIIIKRLLMQLSAVEQKPVGWLSMNVPSVALCTQHSDPAVIATALNAKIIT